MRYPLGAVETASRICPHCGNGHPNSFAHCPTTGDSLFAGQALVGQTVGRYRVLELLGGGGMGEVYRALHIGLDREVAIKRLRHGAQNENALTRFRREARAAAATGHEHIVDVLDLGVDRGSPFLVMELLAGEPLSTRLARESPLTVSVACQLVTQILKALVAVHERGIVHRDLKPDNVFITKRDGLDFVKVLDFGVSKFVVDPETTLTRTGTLMGTPRYMSPEQARGVRDVDHRVDLYACGVILYECLAGHPPFDDSENYNALLHAILASDPPHLTLVADVDPGLARQVHRALSRDPDDRFETAVDMLKALALYATDESPAPRDDGPTPARPFTFHVSTLTPNPNALSLLEPLDPAEPYRAPRAGRLADFPTPFVTQSTDWTEPMSRPPRPPPRPSAPPTGFPGGAGHVRGSLMLAAVRFLRERFGDRAFEDAIVGAPPETYDSLTGVILPVAWLKMPDLYALLERAESGLGESDGALSRQVGEAVARRDLPVTHRLFMQAATPETAIRRFPKLFAAYHDHGSVSLFPGEAEWNVTIRDLKNVTYFHDLAITGFIDGLLALAGATDHRVTMITSRGRGADATQILVRLGP